jgi:hypothetical protein
MYSSTVNRLSCLKILLFAEKYGEIRNSKWGTKNKLKNVQQQMVNSFPALIGLL